MTTGFVGVNNYSKHNTLNIIMRYFLQSAFLIVIHLTVKIILFLPIQSQQNVLDHQFGLESDQ